MTFKCPICGFNRNQKGHTAKCSEIAKRTLHPGSFGGGEWPGNIKPDVPPGVLLSLRKSIR